MEWWLEWAWVKGAGVDEWRVPGGGVGSGTEREEECLGLATMVGIGHGGAITIYH